MKVKILLPIYLLVGTLGFSQNTDTVKDSKHEFRIDVVEGIAVPALDVSYEYLISKNAGVGLSGYFGYQKEVVDYLDNAIDGYFRGYILNKKEQRARGFYVEGIVRFAKGQTPYVYSNGSTDFSRTWEQFGVGFGVGYKFVFGKGFIVDLGGGFGKYFGEEQGAPSNFFRGNISFGYRI